MASKSIVIYTARDEQIHRLLALTPLDTQQLLKASEIFSQPFTGDRKLRQRMQEHQQAGWSARSPTPQPTSVSSITTSSRPPATGS